MARRGFTLIEVLVVISIIVVLVGLLVPVSNSVRQQARSTTCQSNVRQLQISLQAYETENGTLPYGFDLSRRPGPFPGSSDPYSGTTVIDLPGWWWLNYLKLQVRPASYYREPGMPECPSKRQEDPTFEWDNLCGNYGVNRALCVSAQDMPPYASAYVHPPVSTSALRQPGSTLLVLDAGYALICWWQATSQPPVRLGNLAADTAYVPGLDINNDRLLRPGQILDAVGGRHPKKTVNIGFADGHTERKRAQVLLVDKTDKDTYANKTPLWEPR
jgi:prepilin-type N-terminal cleavage/methylation domain-containing protein/prepilin-type processing-associated H-X9-DG protein